MTSLASGPLPSGWNLILYEPQMVFTCDVKLIKFRVRFRVRVRVRP